ncbi:MAG: EAL domain-containing protein [Proteobacteria bacterium]|nr:EAL domain-containing protein [Pseudomonadota bacterium]
MPKGPKTPITRYVAAAVIFLAVAALYLSGALRFVDNKLLEAQFAVFGRDATPDLVIVAIDAESLEELGTWPWPREYHARVLEALLDAGADRIAFDVDFSSASNADADSRFARALTGAGSRVILPVFKQYRQGNAGEDAGEPGIILTEPLAAFRDKAALASVSLRPDADGVVRRVDIQQPWKDGTIPFLAAKLAGIENHAGGTYHIDFGISPNTIPQISYADVLAKRFDPGRVAGKRVIVGATAVQLGDNLSAPRWGIIPGVRVMGLIYQSLVQDRLLQRLNPLFVLAVAGLLIFVLGPVYAGWNWRKSLALLVLTWAAVTAAAMAAHHEKLILDTSAILLATTLCFVSGIISQSNWMTLRIRHQGAQIRDKDAMMKGVVRTSFDGILILDETGVILDANPAAGKLFGEDADKLAGRPIGTLIPDASGLIRRPGAGAAPMARARRHETVARRTDESTFPVEIAMREMSTDNGRWQIAFVRDITDRKAHQEALEHQALHDALTGLPNRTYLAKRLDDTIRRAARTGEHFALLILDLDRFKEINDTLGHHIGDLVLRQIATRLKTPLRRSDMIARLGGDEFAILLSPVYADGSVTKLAGRLQKALEAPMQCKGMTLDVGASIGVAIFPDDGTDATELVQKADIAMYVAKNAGLPLAFYDSDQDQNSVRHLTLTGELKRAIEGEQLELHYQPKISVETNQVIGVEALARWHHPEHGYIPAEEFITLAEQTGLIQNLTEWALRTSIGQSARWRAAGMDLSVSVNLSAKILQDDDLPRFIEDLLGEYGVEPERLVLEITESAIMADSGRSKAVIDRLAEKGMKLSIDDFGTGYSSLAYLKDLPVHELKIDKSFVMDMVNDESDQVIVKSTIQLAHNLGLTVVAEGVETKEALALLADMDADVAQGYFISKALPIGDFDDWLHTWRAAAEGPRLAVVAGGY